MKLENLLISTIAATVLALAGSSDAHAQADAGTGSDAYADAPAAASDAKRVVRIRRVIALDKQRVAWLRSELRARSRWFEQLATDMEEIGDERNELRAKLEEREASGNADAAAELRAQIEELAQDFDLFETQTDLALKAEKTVREQILALEQRSRRKSTRSAD